MAIEKVKTVHATSELFNWLYDMALKVDRQTITAVVVAIILLAALCHSSKSSKAAERSAKAAETSNRHAERSAEAAEVSSQIARAGFENEARRIKGLAYWSLYRIYKTLDGTNLPSQKNIELSPVQTLLSGYGYTLPPEVRDALAVALFHLETVIHASFHQENYSIVKDARQVVREAGLKLKEPWMQPWEDFDKQT